jgi:hypothetical protein
VTPTHALDAAIAAARSPQPNPNLDPKQDPKQDPNLDPTSHHPPVRPSVRLVLPLDKILLILSLTITLGTVAIMADAQAPKPERAISANLDRHFASARLTAGLVRPRDVAIAALPPFNLADLDLPTLTRAAGPWIGWATFSLFFLRGIRRAQRHPETD